MNPNETLHGGCHCGAIRFEVDYRGEAIYDCNCSMCTKKGILHLIVEASQFRLIRGEFSIREYRFGTKTAVHKFCETCGIHPFYTPRSHPDGIDVNLRCVDGFDAHDWEITPFDGQDWEQHVAEIR